MVITLDSVSELLEDIAIFIQQIEGITIISEVIGRHHHIWLSYKQTRIQYTRMYLSSRWVIIKLNITMSGEL